MFSINILVVVITIIVSISTRDTDVYHKLMLSPYQVIHRKKWYQLITHAFIHSKDNFLHLIFNMYVLYSFGNTLVHYLSVNTYSLPVSLWYLIIYVGGIFASSLPSLLKHKNDPSYHSLGASGAVSAVVFSVIAFNPISGGIGIIFIPGISLPPIIFGLLFLAYEKYASKKQLFNIAHDAHFYGAIYGFLFTIIIVPNVAEMFLDQVMFIFR